MDCLNDILCGKRTIIGIRDYSDCTAPESSLWLNDLPGISLKIAANVVNAETQTGVELMKKCINTAIQEVFSDFEKEISPYFDFNSIVETRQVDDYRNADILLATSLDRGLVMKRWRSELARIYSEEIYIKLNTTGTISLKIYDGDTLLETITGIEIVAGKVKTIRYEKIFKNELGKILLDNSAVEVYSAPIRNFGYGGECGSCPDGGQGFRIKGWDGTEEDNMNYGIGVKASVRCYQESAVCSILPKLWLAIWYKSGSKFMAEKIYSDRLNPVTTCTRERAKELREEYDLEYKQRYATTTKNIQAFLRSMKGECVTCNTNKHGQFTP